MNSQPGAANLSGLGGPFPWSRRFAGQTQHIPSIKQQTTVKSPATLFFQDTHAFRPMSERF